MGEEDLLAGGEAIALDGIWLVGDTAAALRVGG